MTLFFEVICSPGFVMGIKKNWQSTSERYSAREILTIPLSRDGTRGRHSVANGEKITEASRDWVMIPLTGITSRI
jgi:hypothetical protein